MDIPWRIPDDPVAVDEALPFASTYQSLRDESDASMFRLMAMDIDAYELAIRFSNP